MTQEYIFGNLYNDYWIANKEIGNFMTKKIVDQTEEIFTLNDILLIINIVCISLALGTIIITILKSVSDYNSFMKSIINHQRNSDI